MRSYAPGKRHEAQRFADDVRKIACVCMQCYLSILKKCFDFCLARQWNDSNMGDEAKANARDLKHSAEQKGREIRDSWR